MNFSKKNHEFIKNNRRCLSKQAILLLATLLISTLGFAQGLGVNYKAAIKDNNENLIANQDVKIRFTITDGESNTVYQETHEPTTDANGIVVLSIGWGDNPNTNFWAIDWGNTFHFLRTEIDTLPFDDYVTMDEVIFNAVPYAYHANKAFTAETAENVSGLEKITEESNTPGEFNTGWRLIDIDPELYGPIGNYAVDLSIIDSYPLQSGATGNFSFAAGNYSRASGSNSISIGSLSAAGGYSAIALGKDAEASGDNSIAIGENSSARGNNSASFQNSIAGGDYSTSMGTSSASGISSTAMGSNTYASGNVSTTMGNFTSAPSYSETAMGRFNTEYTPANTNGDGVENWNPTDRLFVIGNGESYTQRNDALIIYKNGNAKFDGKIQHTSTGSANMIPIAYGIVESNGNTLANTDNFTATVNSGVFTIDVNDTESLGYDNTVCVITPISSLARTSSTLIADGNNDGDSDIIVRIFNSSGLLAATTFQFVIYKL